MNTVLQKEIIKQIFDVFSIFNENSGESGLIEKIVKDKFLLAKKIAFETDDKIKHENNIWAAYSTVGNSNINILIADIKDNLPEFTIIIQMDTMNPCAIRLSLDPDDFGSLAFNIKDNIWTYANTLTQARALVGVQTLSEIFLDLKKLEKYDQMYKYLIGFLNFEENNEG